MGSDRTAEHRRPPNPEVVSFGPFRLYPSERLLENAGVATPIGGRALDILIALASRPGEIISPHELMREVWSVTTVSEATLRMQITALRRALSSAPGRYLTNVPGRGYCFVAPVSISRPGQSPGHPQARHTLPPRLGRMIGRANAIHEITASLTQTRFVTITGAAGIGKTTVAIQLAHVLLEAFDQAVYFIDLGVLTDPDLVTATLLTAMGLPSAGVELRQAVLNYAQGKPLLLVFDNCEHVIESVASVIADLVDGTEIISILATSREALRLDTEHVFRLAPLRYPRMGEALTAGAAMEYSAVQLLVERVSSAVDDFELSDEEAPAAAEICARLDGVPLALEIAAGRVDAFGIRQTATLLTGRLGLDWQGRRTGASRQRTLGAALDWSYALLSARERLILQRLSIFVGVFTLDAAQGVATGDSICESDVADAIVGLVSKSLVNLAGEPRTGRLQLLQTTRAFGRDRLEEGTEFNQVSARHARHFLQIMRRLNEASPVSGLAEAFEVYGEHLDNVRAALGWAFAAHGDLELAVSLSSQAAPLFLELSLLAECRGWMLRAIKHLRDVQRDDRREMEIHAALGVSTMFTKGADPDARQAFDRALGLAEALGDDLYSQGVIGMLSIFQQRVGDYGAAMEMAHRAQAVTQRSGDPIAVMVSQWTLGVACYLFGDHARAQTNCESALLPRPTNGDRRAIRFLGYDHRIRALVVETISLWLRGYQDRAAEAAQLAVAEAERGGQPISMCIAYINLSTIRVWAGDLTSADEVLERVVSHAERFSLQPYRAAALGLRGDVQIKLGNIQQGVVMLQENLAALNRENYSILTPGLMARLAEGFAALGLFADARETIEAAIRQCAARNDRFDIADHLRVLGDIQATQPCPDVEAAERTLLQAIRWAQDQSALSWELRAATSLGKLWFEAGRSAEAKSLVADLCGRFTEGFSNTDLQDAKLLLAREVRSPGLST